MNIEVATAENFGEVNIENNINENEFDNKTLDNSGDVYDGNEINVDNIEGDNIDENNIDENNIDENITIENNIEGENLDTEGIDGLEDGQIDEGMEDMGGEFDGSMDMDSMLDYEYNDEMGMGGMDLMSNDGMMGMETGVKDPFLSSWVPIAGISTATLVIAVVLGILLARRKIKKGFGLYED